MTYLCLGTLCFFYISVIDFFIKTPKTFEISLKTRTGANFITGDKLFLKCKKLFIRVSDNHDKTRCNKGMNEVFKSVLVHSISRSLIGIFDLSPILM
jgi:hypothetical protein